MRHCLTCLAVCYVFAWPAGASEMPPALTPTLTPSSITVGQTSRLTYRIYNANASALTNISFTNHLSPNVIVAFPRDLTNECAAETVLTGGGMIRVAGLHLEAGQSCEIGLNVTSSTKGLHTNVIDGVYSAQSPPGPEIKTVLVVEGPPLAVTGTATNITDASALLEGVAHLYGASADVYFEFGPTTTYGQRTSLRHIAAGYDAVPVNEPIMGLEVATTYHYRFVASNSYALSVGVDQSFVSWGHPSGTALAVDGVDDYFLSPELSTFFTNENMTIELWFKALGPGVLVEECGEQPPSSAFRNAQIWIDPSSYVFIRVPTDNGRIGQVGPIFFGTWNHVALRYDKSVGRGEATGFLNGVPTGGFNRGRITPWSAGYELYYAFGLIDSDPWRGFFRGELDDIRIWNYPRTDAQIRDNIHRRLTCREPGLVAFWRLNDGVGTSASDSSGNNNGGTLINGVQWVSSQVPLKAVNSPLAHEPNCSAILRFSVAPNQTFRIQASANLLNWSDIGTLQSTASGLLEFEDMSAGGFVSRFYRAVTP